MDAGSKEGDDSGAAIVCGHVAKQQMPILRARRDAPAFPEDSGWQFLCNCGEDESESEAQIWSVNEVLQHEPTLKEFIDAPAGIVLTRPSPESPWQVVPANR
jgi:hypothetical protein